MSNSGEVLRDKGFENCVLILGQIVFKVTVWFWSMDLFLGRLLACFPVCIGCLSVKISMELREIECL